MSVPAGNDYYDKVAFAERFPGMLTHGYTFQYQLVGNRELYSNKPLMWGYMADFIDKIRFNLPLSEVYTKLGEFAKTKDTFVITTNADGLFERHGFNPERIFTPQGDFKYVFFYFLFQRLKINQIFSCFSMKVSSMFKTVPKGFSVRQQTDCGDPSSTHRQRNTIA